MRVLVAEDARSLADRVAEGLRDQGMAVDIARDGLEAAARLDINAYDVVVLDRDLPGIHGDALCQMITSRDQRAMVLMLTAAGSPDDRVSGLGLGADDYLAKPFHFPELVLRIRALARRQPAARPRILRQASNSTPPRGPRPATDGRWACRSRSSPSWRPCCTPAPRSCPPRISLRQHGTSTPTRSPPPSPSPSAACAANSAIRPSSPPPQAPATASPARRHKTTPLPPDQPRPVGDSRHPDVVSDLRCLTTRTCPSRKIRAEA